MLKPYVQTEEPSASGCHVSMVADRSILPDEFALGCNNCWNGLSRADLETEEGVSIFLEWQDLGDSGVLCPACREESNDSTADNPAYSDLDDELRTLVTGYTLGEILERLAVVVRQLPQELTFVCPSGTTFSEEAYCNHVATTLEALAA